MRPHPAKEWLDVIDRLREDNLALVEGQADPEIVHEDGESKHDCGYTPWATEFVSRKDALSLARLFEKCGHTTRDGQDVCRLLCQHRSLWTF